MVAMVTEIWNGSRS